MTEMTAARLPGREKLSAHQRSGSEQAVSSPIAPVAAGHGITREVKDPVPQPAPDLLVRLLRHDGKAWAELVRQYSSFLLGVSRRTFSGYGATADGHDCEDAVADVWRNLLENDLRLVRQCLERSNFLQTMQVLVRNRSVDILRRRPKATTELFEGVAEAVPSPTSDTPDINPQALAQAMDKLTPRERTLIHLFFLQRRRYHQIAAITGIPQNSIGPTLSRALAKLRRELDASQ